MLAERSMVLAPTANISTPMVTSCLDPSAICLVLRPVFLWSILIFLPITPMPTVEVRWGDTCSQQEPVLRMPVALTPKASAMVDGQREQEEALLTMSTLSEIRRAAARMTSAAIPMRRRLVLRNDPSLPSRVSLTAMQSCSLATLITLHLRLPMPAAGNAEEPPARPSPKWTIPTYIAKAAFPYFFNYAVRPWPASKRLSRQVRRKHRRRRHRQFHPTSATLWLLFNRQVVGEQMITLSFL